MCFSVWGPAAGAGTVQGEMWGAAGGSGNTEKWNQWQRYTCKISVWLSGEKMYKIEAYLIKS